MKDIHNLLNIKSNNIIPERGKILISEPLLGDYYFKRSVVLLAEHNEEGSFGLIMNKPLTTRFNDIVKDFPDFETQIYLGGPVQNSSLFFVHSLGERIEESQEIIKGLFWGGNLEQIKELMILQQLKKDDIRFYVGYSGWGSNQLEEELQKNSWLVSDIELDVLFNTHPDKLWDRTLRDLGTNYSHWKNFPSDPGMN